MFTKFNQFQLSEKQQQAVLGGAGDPFDNMYKVMEEMRNKANALQQSANNPPQNIGYGPSNPEVDRIREAAQFKLNEGIVSGTLYVVGGSVGLTGFKPRPSM